MQEEINKTLRELDLEFVDFHKQADLIEVLELGGIVSQAIYFSPSKRHRPEWFPGNVEELNIKQAEEISRLKSTIKLIWQTAGEPEGATSSSVYEKRGKKLMDISELCRKELEVNPSVS